MNTTITWEEYQLIKTLLNQWDYEMEFGYESDKLDKNIEIEIDNYFY